MDTKEKTRENRLRRVAERRGYILRKSRRRDPHAQDFGAYWIVEASRNRVLSHARGMDDLDEVEAWLAEDAAAA